MSGKRAARKATVSRVTKETDVQVRLNLDGSGKAECNVDDQFLRHMVETLARYSGVDLEVSGRDRLLVLRELEQVGGELPRFPVIPEDVPRLHRPAVKFRNSYHDLTPCLSFLLTIQMSLFSSPSEGGINFTIDIL